MITLVVIPGFWKEAHEADQSKKGNRKVCRGRRAGFAARCKSRSQDRPYPRNTHLYLEGRQGRSGETVKQQKRCTNTTAFSVFALSSALPSPARNKIGSIWSEVIILTF